MITCYLINNKIINEDHGRIVSMPNQNQVCLFLFPFLTYLYFNLISFKIGSLDKYNSYTCINACIRMVIQLYIVQIKVQGTSFMQGLEKSS